MWLVPVLLVLVADKAAYRSADSSDNSRFCNCIFNDAPPVSPTDSECQGI